MINRKMKNREGSNPKFMLNKFRSVLFEQPFVR